MSRRRLVITLLIFCTAVPIHGKDWKFLRSPNEETERLTILVKGHERTYYQANDLSLTVTGPGYIKLYTRWIGPRPTDRDTTYQVTVNVGRKRHTKRFRTTRSAVAGIPRSGLWVGKSRTLTLPLPNNTVTIRTASSGNDVFVRPFFSKRQASLGSLRSMSPDTYSDVVLLVLRERERKYFRTTVEQPVELDIIGPTTLVVYSRLEFTYDMKGLQNFGIQIWEDDALLHSYAWSTSRSDVTRYLERDDLVPSPGQKIIVQVPRGEHRWTFKPSSSMKDVLLRFLIPERDL